MYYSFPIVMNSIKCLYLLKSVTLLKARHLVLVIMKTKSKLIQVHQFFLLTPLYLKFIH